MSTKTLSTRAGADVVARAVEGSPRVPGVVAGVTDREGIVSLHTAGVRDIAADTPMSEDTVFAIFSTTKAITGTVALQLLEEGKLDLSAPAKAYVPEIGELGVLEGFDESGDPVVRPPKSDVTVEQLLLHTAGFGYDFFNASYHRLAREHGQPSIVSATMRALRTPLLFDPGSRWEYGSNIDWLGLVIESIEGRRLGDSMAARVFEPLGMTDTGFEPAGRSDRLATMHQREADGTLTPLHAFVPPEHPEVHMGGHGLLSTVGDYLRFIRMWLNDGRADDGTPLLRPDTIALAERNHLGDLIVRQLPGEIPSISNDAEFFPGQRKTWGYTFMINEEEAPTGRPAGSLAWAGLANLYYWIDRRNGIGGYWATQILPFADPASVGGYLDFETAVYDDLRG